jgi:hypothetical protein
MIATIMFHYLKKSLVMMHISAKTEPGIEILKELLIESQKGLSTDSDEEILGNLFSKFCIEK